MQGLQKTKHADTKFYSLPPNAPQSVWLYNLPAGVPIKPAQDGYERDGYAHVYDNTEREGWIAIADLTPATTTPAVPKSGGSPLAPSDGGGMSIDWRTIAITAGILVLVGGGAYYLMHKGTRRRSAREAYEAPRRRRRRRYARAA